VKNKHKFFDQERLDRLQSLYTVDDLRKLLAGKRWGDLVNDRHIYSSSGIDGVRFTVRVGQFLGRGAVAVLAQQPLPAAEALLRRDAGTTVTPG